MVKKHSNPEPGVIQGLLNGSNVGGRLKEKSLNANVNYERKYKVSLKRVINPRKKLHIATVAIMVV
jgi:hypothetical protein